MQSVRASMLAKPLRNSSNTSLTAEENPRNEQLPAGSDGGVSGAIATLAAIPALPSEFGLSDAPVSLQHSLAGLLVWRATSRFSAHGFDGVDYSEMRVVPAADPASVQRALTEISRLCEPSGPRVAGRHLTELLALTVSRSRDDVDRELMGAAYTERLSQYPADVVKTACSRWADREEFWPSWAELKAECDKHMRGRKQIRDALLEWRP